MCCSTLSAEAQLVLTLACFMAATKVQSINKCLLKSELAIKAHLMAYVQHQQRWAVSIYAQQLALHPVSLAAGQTAHVCDSHHGFGADRSNASWGCHLSTSRSCSYACCSWFRLLSMQLICGSQITAVLRVTPATWQQTVAPACRRSPQIQTQIDL
jgi:hypothetical protein